MKHFGPPPSVDQLENIALEAFAAIPKELRSHAKGLLIRVQDFPDDGVLDALDGDSAFDLLGLYQGVDLIRKTATEPDRQPDVVYLYRRPILDYWCDSEEDLTHVIRHVLIHEIGHHFGFSDDDMEAIEEWAR